MKANRLRYKLLSTGYHYVRAEASHHLFAQWPVGRACTAEDVSGSPCTISYAEFAAMAQELAEKESFQ